MNARALALACVLAAGTAHGAQVCRWTAADGSAAFGPTLPPGARGQCDAGPTPAPAAAPVDRLRALSVQRARIQAGAHHVDRVVTEAEANLDQADAARAANAAARRALERAADPRDQSIESLILRARAHRAAAR